MNENEIVENYLSASSKLMETLELTGYCPPEKYTSVCWSESNGEILFGYKKDKLNYSIEIRYNINRDIGDYTVRHVDDGCGNKFLTIFDLKKKLENNE